MVLLAIVDASALVDSLYRTIIEYWVVVAVVV